MRSRQSKLSQVNEKGMFEEIKNTCGLFFLKISSKVWNFRDWFTDTCPITFCGLVPSKFIVLNSEGQPDL